MADPKTRSDEQDVLSEFPDEVKHLEETEELIGKELKEADAEVQHLIEVYEETKQDRQDKYYDMDGREHLQMERILKEMDRSVADAEKIRMRVEKLQDSPYFARIDFGEDGHEAEPYYIGRFGFEQDHDLLIYDWRAPVSSMFYDCETGPAGYLAPIGRIEGTMSLKRQFRVKGGELEYVVDTSQTVSDDVLQQELSRTSDEKMKTIIATIQHEQNIIIRNESRKTMIIQGVAGSGKTSIALHRIAFLLYRFKNNIKAQEVMILSPNKAFADYISSVIPELGEEPIRESSFYEIAMDLLDNVIDFEDEISPFDVSDESWKERARFKSSPEFLEALKRYAESLPERIFQPKDFVYEGRTLEKEWIRKAFLFYRNDSILGRLPDVADDFLEELRLRVGLRFELPRKGFIIDRLKSWLTIKSPAALYRDFYKETGISHMLNMKNTRLEWPDVYPFLLLYDAYKGLGRHMYVKHLMVDEMQDYTPVQYEVLNRMYPCQKTILGDFGQSMNPCHAFTLQDLLDCFPDSQFMEMNKSFRSTREIMNYACRISPQTKLDSLDRHGDKPVFLPCRDENDETDTLVRLIRTYEESPYNSLGIILKTNKDAALLYEKLVKDCPEVQLLTPQSKEYKGGISVTSVQMAKGLEFDEVLIPQADETHYSLPFDRNLLYVACTRAMHKLTLTGIGAPSPFLPE